jgi:A-macroglobulin receptor binding domain
VNSYLSFQKFESLNGGTRVAIYLDNVGETEVCFKVSAQRLFEVQNLKKALVEVKDYYDQGKHFVRVHLQMI